MTLPKILWLTVSGLSLLVAVSAYAQAIEWADAMKAAERALNESRYEEAEQYLRTAVRYAGTLSTLARLYSAEGKHADAEAALKRSVAIRERGASPRSLDLAGDLDAYARLLCTMHRDSEAVALEARAAAIRAEHPAAELSKRTSETR